MKRLTVCMALLSLVSVLSLFGQKHVWAAVGDCTNLKIEDNADCDNQVDCVPNGTCFPQGYTCASGDVCSYGVAVDNRKKGKCVNGWSDDGCIHCDGYVCAKWKAYLSIDNTVTPPQCQGPKCDVFRTCNDCCTPDAGGT